MKNSIEEDLFAIGKKKVPGWLGWSVVGVLSVLMFVAVYGFKDVAVSLQVSSSQSEASTQNVGQNQLSSKIPIDQLISQNDGVSAYTVATSPASAGSPALMMRAGVGGKTETVNSLPPNLAAELQSINNPSYIIKLKDPSLAEKKAGFDKTASSDEMVQLKAYKTELIAKQDTEINNLKSLIPSLRVKTRFTEAFSGVLVEISDANAEQLRSKGYDVEINASVHITLPQSVPLIHGNDVWATQDSSGLSVTGRGVRIAIIDTGVDYHHSDLGGCFGIGCKVAGGYDIANNDSDPMDDFGHGTHVASIAAGNGALKGVAPDATIYAYKVLNQNGSGYFSDIITGIGRALDPNLDGDFSDGAQVINISLGGEGNPDDPLSQAVDNAVHAGVVVAVAAGNDGPRHGTILSPGTAREAITVGASDKQDVMASFSSRGPVVWGPNKTFFMKPDIVAPGVSICAARWSNWLPGYECNGDSQHIAISGTSMAAPHVAGIAALLKQLHSDWTPQEIKTVLKETAVPIGNDPLAVGFGRVDALRAAQASRPLSDTVVTIESPGVMRGSSYSIRGTISPTGFMGYRIEIGKSNPLNSNTTYQEVFRSTSLPSGGFLAQNLPRPSDYGFYSIKLTVAYRGGVRKSYYASLMNLNGQDFELMRGWPRRPLAFPAGFWGVGSTPLTYDLDGDGRKEIITYSLDQVTVWKADGTIMPGWPKTTDNGVLTSGAGVRPSIGDIDGDGQPEIFIPEFWDFYLVNGHACGYAWHANGSPVNGWLNHCGINPQHITDGSSLLYNLVGDGALEIILRTSELRNNLPHHTVYILRGDGTVANGWPLEFPSTTEVRWYVNMPAIGDIDGNGVPEIVLLTSTDFFQANRRAEVRIYDTRGILQSSFPVLPPGSYGDVVLLADIDNDGRREVGYPAGSNDPFYKVVFYNDEDGSTVSGWPHDNAFGQLNELMTSSLLGDQNLAVIYPYHELRGDVAEYIAVLNPNGQQSTGWPQLVGGSPLWVRPQTADITRDGQSEIVTTTSSGLIYAWQANGALVSGFPLEMFGPSFSGTAIDDIDGDGQLELVAGTHDGTIYVWKLKNTNANVRPWPMFKHDAQNTGLLNR